MAAVSSTTSTTSTSSTTTTTSNQSTVDATADRFLKLLVAQMKNQDPLNPMDNAQVTTQMAQINTVSGIAQLNKTMTTLGDSFTQSQLLQGAALVGRSVLVEGNKLVAGDDGTASAGFELAGKASSVQVEVLSASGAVIDTIDLGGLDAGQHGFTWEPSSGVGTDGVTFQVVAKNGSTSVTATPLNVDQVTSVSNESGSLTLQLQNNGSLAYSKVKSVA
ncbi:MAG: flagellar hook assembly protein FlgD [Burkholderiales bacterium]|nr:flagellar hook assembly protein FlgD [Burkholderiales bacterium]